MDKKEIARSPKRESERVFYSDGSRLLETDHFVSELGELLRGGAR